MSAPNDGGPAFPRAGGDYFSPHDGMTLRDWFAGQALAGISANAPFSTAIAKAARDIEDANARFAESAYDLADAMLKERNRNA